MPAKHLFLLLIFSVPVITQAQNYKYPYGSDDDLATSLAAIDPANRAENELRNLLRIGRGTNLTKLTIRAGGPAGYKKLLQAVEDARMDKQAGSSPSSEGTTSVVSKGVAAQVLSMAVEHGALTRTDNKSLATFRGNALGVARLMAGAEQFPYCATYDYDCESPLARGLGGASFSVSFDTAPNNGNSLVGTSVANPNANVLSGSTRQIAQWGLRFDFHVRRSVLAKNYQQAFATKIVGLKQQADPYIEAVDAIQIKLLPTAEYVAWENKYTSLLQSSESAGELGMTKLLNQAVTELIEIAKQKDPSFQTNVENLLTKMGGYFGSRDKVLDDVVNRVTYSFEYNNNRPQNQPTQSTAKFILSGRPDRAEKWQLTFNGTAEWYDRIPQQAKVSRFRDAQIALQADRAFGTLGSKLGTSLSAGYYYQYMADNALLDLPSEQLAPGTNIPLPGNASVLLNTKGSVHLGAAQFTFTINGTGIKIPLGLTFSNRTELIKATDVRGHFGITYDLDSLFTKK